MMNTILFPSSYFDINKVDEDLEQEYQAALSTDFFNIVIFSYDKWFNDGVLKLNKAVDSMISAVYRGWMMKPEQYEAFYKGLSEKNIHLITDPKSYELMHIFPNVYSKFGEDTAHMEIFPLHSDIDVEYLKKNFKRFMVKDYVKSVKGTEFPKYFDQTITQSQFDKDMELFYKYRGNLLTGGICVKEYLNLKRYGEVTNEYRAFYIKHEVATLSKNSNQGMYVPLPPEELINKYRNIDSIYYTVDYAELEDGSWRVIEAGDGSVSGLSPGQDYEVYYRALFHCLSDL